MDPELVKKMLAVIESQDEKAALALISEAVASMAGATSSEPAAEAMAEGAEPKPPAPGEEPVAASTVSALAKSLGCKTDAEAIDLVKGMQAQLAKTAADAAVVELSARQELTADLVKLGVEFPSTAWQGKPEDRKPVKRLLDEPIADLRARVELHKKSKPAVAGHAPPPSGNDPAPITLSKAEQDYCTKKGLTPEQFEAKKASAVRSAK